MPPLPPALSAAAKIASLSSAVVLLGDPFGLPRLLGGVFSLCLFGDILQFQSYLSDQGYAGFGSTGSGVAGPGSSVGAPLVTAATALNASSMSPTFFASLST